MRADAVIEEDILGRRDLLREDVPGADGESLLDTPRGYLVSVAAAAGGEHDDVGALGEHYLVGCLDAEPAVDAQALRLEIEPANDTGHLLALRGFGGKVDLTADLLVALEQH